MIVKYDCCGYASSLPVCCYVAWLTSYILNFKSAATCPVVKPTANIAETAVNFPWRFRS
ncbi:hypothetical protein NWP17_13080 [Chrysosporum bergii ANA360D]|uniref:Uncharacterized protein n=1 Tax=Chrysosporum bergii ANA360D TaxID=617107 RepID=A0AA43GTB4_9CYAN|nr:hypothetical protein [Chrysosporum bergii]MDH6061357.1 hypothetical protein [Chrysosporum bergii ANA360D]